MLDEWYYLRGVKLDFIRPGKLMENGFIEPFNGRLPDECLIVNVLAALDEARVALRLWQHEYNRHRPHRYPKELVCPLTHGPSTTRSPCLQTMHEAEHTIVIVGADPTGLAPRAELKRLGNPSLILDRLQAGANTSRAAVVHTRTLEALEPLEVTPESLREGVIVPGTLWAACSAFVPVAVIANLAVEAIPHTVGIGFSPQLRYAVVTPICALVCLLSAAVYPVLKRNVRRPLLILGTVLVALALLALTLMAAFGSLQLARNAIISMPCSAARWEKALPYHRTIVLPNANHFFFEDATRQVTDEMRIFLTSETTNAN